MFEPYRRDLIAKSLFRCSEILFGVSFASILFSPLPVLLKVALVCLNVLLFGAGVGLSPKTSPTKETDDG